MISRLVLLGCETSERPQAYEPIAAGEYLDEGLAEIGLKDAEDKVWLGSGGNQHDPNCTNPGVPELL